MKRALLLLLLSVLLIAPAGAEAPAPQSPEKPFSVTVGGAAVTIPPPATDFVEVGYDIREQILEVFVVNSNRLLAGFVPAKTLPTLTRRDGSATLSRYAMAQVPRRAENADMAAADFVTVIDSMKRDFGDVVSRSAKEAQDEVGRRLKEINPESQLSIDQPVLLGSFFSKTDAYGFGMVTTVKSDAKNARLLVGAALTRVKQRLIFLYVYAEYENEASLTWLRETTEGWADATLKANAPAGK